MRQKSSSDISSVKNGLLILVCAVGILILGHGAWAQESEPEPDTAPPAAAAPAPKAAAKPEKDKKKTSIDFEDELIQGEVKKPELFYLLQKKQFNFKRLIKLREDFLPEMRRSADDLRRGSKN